MQIGDLLIGELQLGQRLNECVQQGNKSEFALLLSMLSQDVRDQDQFALEQPTSDKHVISLAEQFEIPTPQTLKTRAIDDRHYSIALAEVSREQGLIASRLQHCLKPDALSFDLDRVEGFADEIIDSLSPTVAARLEGKTISASKPKVDINKVIAAQQSYDAQLFVA
ncbi:MAG: VC2046/SO_2500 family protein [Psychrobium sp.]